MSLDKIAFSEDIVLDKGDFLRAINARGKEITSILSKAKGLEAKVRRARRLPFQEARGKFIALQSRCTAFSAFNQPRA